MKKEKADQKPNGDASPIGIEFAKIFTLYTQRTYCEELDFIQSKCGLKWLYQGLSTSLDQGITQASVPLRAKQYGSNVQYERIPKPFLHLLFNVFEDFSTWICFAAAVICIAIDMGTQQDSNRSISWIEGIGILIAICIWWIITLLNDFLHELKLRSLNNSNNQHLIVTRDEPPCGWRYNDCYAWDGKQQIPVDGILVQGGHLIVDESSITGESKPIKKATLEACQKVKKTLEDERRLLRLQDRFEIPSPVILSGTHILEGDGQMLVCRVGDQSMYGNYKKSQFKESEKELEEPLAHQLNLLARTIGKFGLFSSLLILLVIIIRLIVERAEEDYWDNSKHWRQLLNFLVIGIVILCAAISKGLKIISNFSTAFNIKQLFQNNNLVRKLQACRKLAAVDTIFLNKSTLTTNNMYLTMIWNMNYIDIDPYADQFSIQNHFGQEIQNLWIQSICCNNSADTYPTKSGSLSEIALLDYIKKCGVEPNEVKKQCVVIKRIPINSQRNMSSIIIEFKNNNDNLGRRLLIKGSPDVILNSLNYFHDFYGRITPIDDELKNNIIIATKNMNQKAMMVQLLAYRNLSGFEDLIKQKDGIFDVEQRGLTFLALIGISDRVREGMDLQVNRCKLAGINVKLITSDTTEQARTIAIQCGIIKQEGQDILEGPQFSSMIGGLLCRNCNFTYANCFCSKTKHDAITTHEEIRIDSVGNLGAFREIIPKIQVMSRCRSEDKYAMVLGLQECDNFVAVTGDNAEINDVPTLLQADVSFSNGITGSEMQKKASSIILLSENFEDIVKSIMWGRNIYQSIRKFVQFQVTVNFTGIIFLSVSAAILKQDVLRPLQLIWINLLMDSLASLTLASELADQTLLTEPPYGYKTYLITKKMFKHIIGQVLYQLGVLFMILFAGELWIPEFSDDYDVTLKEKYSSNYKQYKYNQDVFINNYERIVSGRFRSIDGNQEQYINIYDATGNPSRHFTILFNIFFMLQWFNYFNCRTIRDEINIFRNIFQNIPFILMATLIFGLQILIVTFGQHAFSCYLNYGLNIYQWLICVGFGLFGWFFGAFLKFIPDACCPEFIPLHEKKKKQIDQTSTQRVLQFNKVSQLEDEEQYMASIKE